MKLSSLGWLILFLRSHLQVQASNVPVRKLGEDAAIEDNRVSWKGQDGFQDGFTCPDPYILSPSADKMFASCCLKGEALKGTSSTAFDCCADGHDIAGSEAVGYRCCPTDQIYNGKVCTNGNSLVNSKCACAKDDQNQTASTEECCEPDECSSGLRTGKLELFIRCVMGNGIARALLSNLRCQQANVTPFSRKTVNF